MIAKRGPYTIAHLSHIDLYSKITPIKYAFDSFFVAVTSNLDFGFNTSESALKSRGFYLNLNLFGSDVLLKDL
jgi:hypothetical protein